MYDLASEQIDDRNDFQGDTVRILVFEYISGGGLLGRALPQDHLQEGELMLHALLRDLSELPGHQIMTLRDARLSPLNLPINVHMLYHSRELAQAMSRSLKDCDAVWPIAPETGGELERLSQAALDHGCALLGSRPEAISIATSKLATIRRLSEHEIPVVTSWSGAQVLAGAPLPDPPWVVKPDDGIGCSGTRIVRSRDDLFAMLLESPTGLIVQPYMTGTHASLSVLAGNGQCILLACNEQRVVVVNDEFRLSGCVVNGVQSGRPALERLARAVVDALPGLWGYFGVDLILNAEQAYVLEVNPRLTTSFAGISAALGVNVPAMVLGLLENKSALEAQPGTQTVSLDLETVYVA